MIVATIDNLNKLWFRVTSEPSEKLVPHSMDTDARDLAKSHTLELDSPRLVKLIVVGLGCEAALGLSSPEYWRKPLVSSGSQSYSLPWLGRRTNVLLLIGSMFTPQLLQLTFASFSCKRDEWFLWLLGVCGGLFLPFQLGFLLFNRGLMSGTGQLKLFMAWRKFFSLPVQLATMTANANWEMGHHQGHEDNSQIQVPS